MRKLLLGGAIVAVLVLLFAVVCRAQPFPQTDMHGEAMWNASTGQLWMKLYRETLDEDDCSTAPVTIYVDADPYPMSYIGVKLGGPFAEWTGYTPGSLLSGSYDGPFQYGQHGNECAGTYLYLLWSTLGLENALIDWVESSTPTFTFYVGKFLGPSMQTGQNCTTCIKQVVWGYKTLKLADDSQPYWEMPATVVTANPPGCSPECNLPTDAPIGNGGPNWGAMKGLFR